MRQEPTARVSRLGRPLALLAILASTASCDQWAKQLARVTLHPTRTYSLPGGILQLRLVENPGAFLSLGASLPEPMRSAVFCVGLGLGLAAGFAYLLRTPRISARSFAAGALVLAGGASNLLDRLSRGGRVTDFAIVSVGPLHTGVFNVADVAITFGVAALLWSLRRRPPGGARARVLR
ncbi:MAG: signal peptidase II [Deltaproteobacteria bacterium]|nr:signal peptidase II [Deltaproteobacteria bacterium]